MYRKTRYYMTALCCIAIIGCAQNKILLDNGDESISEIENLREALAPDLQFLGKVKIAEKAGSVTRPRGASLTSESLVYGRVSEDNVLEKGMIIRTYEILGESGNILDDLFTKNDTIIDSGTMRIAGRNISYDLLAEQDILEQNERKLTESKGLIVKDCYFVKDYRVNLKGLLDKSKSQILFFDTIDTGRADLACMQLAHNVPQGKDTLPLSEFNRQADASLKILLEGKPDVKNSSGEGAVLESDVGSPASGTTELERKLSTLKKLLDKGLITQTDYEKKKSELLEEF